MLILYKVYLIRYTIYDTYVYHGLDNIYYILHTIYYIIRTIDLYIIISIMLSFIYYIR